MKNTYAAPTVITRGSVVLNTLNCKSPVDSEINYTQRPTSSSNLSFGL